MPRLLSSYAANKRVEDGLKRKKEQIRLDYIRATHRHLDETAKLVDDLIHINVRTPSAFELRPPSSGGAINSPRLIKSAYLSPATQSQGHGYTPNAETKERPQDGFAHDKMGVNSSGISPANFRTDLNAGKSPAQCQPAIQIRGNEVFYQYKKQKQDWKKVEPSSKTKLLLHRNNTVIKALSHFNSHLRHDEASSDKTPSEDCSISNINPSLTRRKSSVYSADIFSRRDSLHMRRGSRRGSRISYLDEAIGSPGDAHVAELKPQLSPGHTPRMLDGWTLMKWCLWNKKETKPVWATRRYAEMKHREYQKFITDTRKKALTEEQPTPQTKPSSAHAPSSSSAHSHRESRVEDSSLLGDDRKQTSAPRAKSVPVGKVKSITFIDEVDDPFPTIDRGILRPVTSILRTRLPDTQADIESKPLDLPDSTSTDSQPRPKSTSRRRVALDTTCVDDVSDIFKDDEDKDDIILYSNDLRSSLKSPRRPGSKTVNILTWDVLTEETDRESTCDG